MNVSPSHSIHEPNIKLLFTWSTYERQFYSKEITLVWVGAYSGDFPWKSKMSDYYSTYRKCPPSFSYSLRNNRTLTFIPYYLTCMWNCYMNLFVGTGWSIINVLMVPSSTYKFLVRELLWWQSWPCVLIWLGSNVVRREIKYSSWTLEK